MYEPQEHVEWRSWDRLIHAAPHLQGIHDQVTAMAGIPNLERGLNQEAMFVFTEDEAAFYRYELVRLLGDACQFAPSDWRRTSQFLIAFINQCIASEQSVPVIMTVIPVRGLQHVQWPSRHLWIEAKEHPRRELMRLRDARQYAVGMPGVQRRDQFLSLGGLRILPEPGTSSKENYLWEFIHERTIHYGVAFGELRAWRIPERWIFPGPPGEAPGVRLPHWLERSDRNLRIIRGPVITFCRLWGPGYQWLSFISFDLDEKTGDILNIRLSEKCSLQQYLLADPNNHVALNSILQDCGLA